MPAERTILENEFGVSSRTFTIESEGIVQRPFVLVRVRALVQRAAEGGKGIEVLQWHLGPS